MGVSRYATGPATFAAIAELVLAIQDDLDQPWTLDRMARTTGFAPHHLAHAFRDVLGLPPMSYVRQLRLERAAYELAHCGQLPLVAIAARSGYTTTVAFH